MVGLFFYFVIDRSNGNRFEFCTDFFHSGSDVFKRILNSEFDLQISTK